MPGKEQFKFVEHPWLSIIIIVFLYIFTLILSDVLFSLLLSGSPELKIFLNIGMFSLLCFFIIPIFLKLPFAKKSLVRLISLFGSNNNLNFGFLIIISFSNYLIFIISQISGSLIYLATQSTDYIFNFSRHSLFDSVTIVSGIFEEIIFRGIILSLLLNHYSERKSILLSAIVFGGIHALNILNPQKEVFWIFSQVVWSFGFGVMYGYIFVKTKSLIPLILLHYLINGMVNVWFYGLDKNDFNSAIYGLPFFGLIPVVLVILLTKYIFNSKKVQATLLRE